MGFLVLPAIIVIILAPDLTPADKLADFSRFATAQGEEVAVVDMFGAERIGRVVAASEANVTLQFGGATRAFDRADVFKADRLRDGNGDGLVKGMLVGGLLGWIAAMELGAAHGFAGSVAVYGGIGYLMDRANTNRTPIYRIKQ